MKKRLSHLVAMVTVAAACLTTNAQNPYLPMWEYIPDGEPYVFDDPDNPGKQRVYVYGSHDMLRTAYCGLDQVVWSAPVDDLQAWRYDGVIFESKKDANGNYLNADQKGDVLYAPDVAVKTHADGTKTYYLYPNNQAGGRQSMVCKSNRPDGPFEVCNWSKDDPRKTEGPFGFDPAAFIDDDGRAYGYWGFNRSYAAELDTATMATVKPGAKIVEDMIPGRHMDRTYKFFEASSIRKIKDKYVFIYSRKTNEGEDGHPVSNYNLAYCYSNSPLGPWTYGGTLIDGRGLERQKDGTLAITATPNCNTHGSICQIGGQWYVFYHRHTGTTEYTRQAMVAPIYVEVMEGSDGYVRITQGEYTSEGFALEGLDPYKRIIAGTACYLTGPEPDVIKYPSILYTGSHSETWYAQYDGKTDPYDPSINRCAMVNNTSGSVVGYKYLNLRRTYGKKGLKMVLNYQPEGTPGTMDIYVDRPTEEAGGVKVGSLTIPAKAGADQVVKISVDELRHYNGKHALFLVFRSDVKGKSLCRLNDFHFVDSTTK